jgi:hypothetical protein
MVRVGTSRSRRRRALLGLVAGTLVAVLMGSAGHAEGAGTSAPPKTPGPPVTLGAKDALGLLDRAVSDPWDIDRALLLPLENATSTTAHRMPPFHAFVEAAGSTHDAVVFPVSRPGGAPKLGGSDDLVARPGVLCRIPRRDAGGAAGDLSADLESAGAPVLEQPQPHAALEERVVLRGRAAGTWFAEAAFPVRLLADDGRELAAANAVADGTWMTTSYVPFHAELRLEGALPDRAMLVLERANPSGLARNAGFVLVRLGCG